MKEIVITLLQSLNIVFKINSIHLIPHLTANKRFIRILFFQKDFTPLNPGRPLVNTKQFYLLCFSSITSTSRLKKSSNIFQTFGNQIY